MVGGLFSTMLLSNCKSPDIDKASVPDPIEKVEVKKEAEEKEAEEKVEEYSEKDKALLEEFIDKMRKRVDLNQDQILKIREISTRSDYIQLVRAGDQKEIRKFLRSVVQEEILTKEQIAELRASQG